MANQTDTAIVEQAGGRFYSVRHAGVEVAYVDDKGNLYVPDPDGFADWVAGADKRALFELSAVVGRKRDEVERGK